MVLVQLDSHMKKLDPYLIPYIKISWKQIKELNQKA